MIETRIALVRHGSHSELGIVLSGRSEIALNAQGWAEANQAARRLATFHSNCVYSSPRTRTVQTSVPIAKLHNGVIALADELDELDFGSLTGESFEALRRNPAWHEWNTNRAEARLPGGETMEEVRLRIVSFIDTLATKGGHHLCVTHGDVIRSALAHYGGKPQSAIFDYSIDPGAIVILEGAFGALRAATLDEGVL